MVGRIVIAMAIGSIGSIGASAQQQSRVKVRDDAGEPVAWAVVEASAGSRVVVNDSGVATLRHARADSLELRVRRIGYREFAGWVRRDDASGIVVTLPRLAVSLGTVAVTERARTPLRETGFYDRMDRVQRGAILGEFLTPEDLDARNVSTITGLVAGSRYAKISSLGSSDNLRARVLVGRGGCAMTIVVDGQVLTGTAQDDVQEEIPQSIMDQRSKSAIAPSGSPNSLGQARARPMSVDDVIDGRSVAAIEVYPSTGNAPSELVRLVGRGSCGIVAVWTGARR